MDESGLKQLGAALAEYCHKYSVPIEHVFEILEDQKVTPMIRGKATEFNAYIKIKELLSPKEWGCEKLNLSAQPNTPDEDISVTHRRTGRRLKVESKNAVRGSMSLGEKSKKLNVPHYKVKCHRSRSNIKLSGKGGSNDRYSVDMFDIILANPYNAIIKGKTVGPELEVIDDDKLLDALYKHYSVSNTDELLHATAQDWRFVLPEKIAENGFIPRTPYVKLKDDPDWLPLSELQAKLTGIVKLTAKKK